MGADGHAFLCAREKARHDVRIAGMEAAGDIGAGHELEHGVVVAHAPRAEAFAEIGVEVDGASGESHEKCESPWKRGREMGATRYGRNPRHAVSLRAATSIMASAPRLSAWTWRSDAAKIGTNSHK